MSSPTKTTTDLTGRLHQIGLRALAANLDDFIARAVKGNWSPRVLLEQLAHSEALDRSRRSLERRLRQSGIGKFKPMADFDWNWPRKIERDVIERALTLDFIREARNLVLIGPNGLGKTMIAKNIGHAAVLAGHSVLFRSAAALIETCNANPTRRAAASCAPMPTPAWFASTRSATSPLTTRPPTCSLKSSTGATSAALWF